jgi:hypothetical protein
MSREPEGQVLQEVLEAQGLALGRQGTHVFGGQQEAQVAEQAGV